MSRKEVPRPGLLKLVLDGKATNAQGAASLRLSPAAHPAAEGAVADRGAGRLAAPQPRPAVPAPPAGAADRPRSTPCCRRATRTSMIATPPRSCARWRACASAASPVRRRRRALGLPAKHRRRARVHRHRRTPEARMGQLVQVDASPFAWLGAGGPAMTLHGAIDDATNTVLALHFRPTEDLHGYAVVFQQLFTQYGVPLAFYGDRINILVRNDPHWSLDEQLRGAQDPTHLGRILHDLGIGYIAAGSPEAKGRVERLWRTLQDRLTSELRLRHITTPEAANAFLPEFLRGLQSALYPDPGGGGPRLAPRPARSRPRAQLSLYAPGRPRQHGPPRAPLDPAPARPPPALLRPLSRRGPGTARWPPRRPAWGGRPRHAAGASQLHPQAPQRPEFRPAPPRATAWTCARAAFTRARGPAHGSGSTRRPRDTVYPFPKPAICTPRRAPPVAQGHHPKGPGPLPRTGMTLSCCS